MAHKTNEAESLVESPASDLTATVEPDAPSFTLRASDPFEFQAFVYLSRVIRGGGPEGEVLHWPREKVAELAQPLHAFDLWDQAHRQWASSLTVAIQPPRMPLEFPATT